MKNISKPSGVRVIDCVKTKNPLFCGGCNRYETMDFYVYNMFSYVYQYMAEQLW
jgi:hypothetical protein